MSSFIYWPVLLAIVTYVQCQKPEVNCEKSVKIFDVEYDMKELLTTEQVPEQVLIDKEGKMLVKINSEVIHLQETLPGKIISYTMVKPQEEFVARASGDYRITEYDSQESDNTEIGRYSLYLNSTNYLKVKVNGDYAYLIDREHEYAIGGSLYVVNKNNIQISGRVVEVHHVSELGMVKQVSVGESGDILAITISGLNSYKIIWLKALPNSQCKISDQCLSANSEDRHTATFARIIQNAKEQMKKTMQANPDTQADEIKIQNNIRKMQNEVEFLKRKYEELKKEEKTYEKVDIDIANDRRRRQVDYDKKETFKCVAEEIVREMQNEIDKSFESVETTIQNMMNITDNFVDLEAIGVC